MEGVVYMNKRRIIKIILGFVVVLFILYRVFLGTSIVMEECVSNDYLYEGLDYSKDSVFVGKVGDILDIKKVGFFDTSEYMDIYLYEMEVVELIEGVYDKTVPLTVRVPNNRINIKGSSFCTIGKLDEDSYYLIAATYHTIESKERSTNERTKWYDSYSSFIVLIDYDESKRFEEQFGPIEDYYQPFY